MGGRAGADVWVGPGATMVRPSSDSPIIAHHTLHKSCVLSLLSSPPLPEADRTPPPAVPPQSDYNPLTGRPIRAPPTHHPSR